MRWRLPVPPAARDDAGRRPMSHLYAAVAGTYHLPPQAPTASAIFSIPRPSGGYDYYRAPPGSAVAWNDDHPLPTVAHPNPIGVSSLTLGRDLPPGSVRIGQGQDAIGSITPMPGAGQGEIASLVALGAVDGDSDPEAPPRILFWGAAAASFVAGLYLVSWGRR